VDRDDLPTLGADILTINILNVPAADRFCSPPDQRTVALRAFSTSSLVAMLPDS
jgi:hypothetical protein